MKKILLGGLLLISNLFSSSLEERVSILEQKVKVLEEKLKVVHKSQTKIVQKMDQGIIKQCDKFKLLKYNYSYDDSGIIQSYKFTYKFKNNYTKSIKYIFGGVSYLDQYHSKLAEDYIKRDLFVKPNSTIVITTNFIIDEGSLALKLKDIPKSNLKAEFKVFTIEFSDGTTLECN